MTKLQLGILSAVILAGGTACWVSEHSARTRLLQKNEALRQQVDQLARLAAENERLSNSLAAGKSPASLSAAELRELLRLRNQVGQLDRTRREADELRAMNQQLVVGLANSGTNQGYWTGEQLLFAGFADPESAMKSTLAAWISGDPVAFLASCVPAARADLEKVRQATSEPEFAARTKVMAGLYRPATEGVRVLGKKTLSQDEAVLDLYFEGDGKSREFLLRRIEDEWKVTGLLFIFN
jgi:hypothetical protein